MAAPTRPPAEIQLRYRIREPAHKWLLESEDVPETPLHDAIIELLMLILKHHFTSHEPAAMVTSNLGCRWDPQDARVGVDPDVVVIQPPPPEGERLTTLRVWQADHAAPRIAVEIVSAHTAEKDYLEAPARCARLGVEELWVFDPLGEGPSSTGGPFALQIWRRVGDAESVELERIHAGPTPAFSPELRAWLIATEGGDRLRIADGHETKDLWPTQAEAEAHRAETEAHRAEMEARRADVAEAEVRRLRNLLHPPE